MKPTVQQHTTKRLINRNVRTTCIIHRGLSSGAIAVLLLLVLLGTHWQPVTPTPVYAQGDIEVTESSATPDFPNSITFSLSARSSAEIVDVTLLYGATRTDTLVMVEVDDFRPAAQTEAEYILNTQVFHFLPGTELTYRWLLEDANGNEMETPPQTLTYHDERFNWQQRTERGVTIYWYKGGNSFGNELMRTTTDALDRLQAEIGAEVVDPVTIYIYANERDMRSAMQTNEVEWVGGLANPSLGIILGNVPPDNTAEIERIIPHELSHQVLHQATDNPYGGVPLWFDEGLAVYNQSQVDSDFPSLVELAAERGQLISLEALSSSFPADTMRARLSYAQSNSVVDYLFDAHGTEQVEQLVAAFEEATPLDEALQQTLGFSSVDELDAAWRATLPDAAPVATPVVPERVSAPSNRFADNPVVP